MRTVGAVNPRLVKGRTETVPHILSAAEEVRMVPVLPPSGKSTDESSE